MRMGYIVIVSCKICNNYDIKFSEAICYVLHALVKVEILAPKYFTESSKRRIQTESYVQQISFILEMITFHTYTMTNTAMMTKVVMTTILLQS